MVRFFVMDQPITFFEWVRGNAFFYPRVSSAPDCSTGHIALVYA